MRSTMYKLRPLRCDFHIHSPRDRRYKGWPSDRMTLSGLYEWSKRILSECRSRQIDVIGVTDHHDLFSAFVTLEVAKAEGYQDIWVFPGLEITSEHGIQAILLLNPDLAKGEGNYKASATEPLQNKVLTTLGQYILAAQDPAVTLQAPSWKDLEGLSALPEENRKDIFKIPKIDRVNKSLDDIAKNMEDHFRDQFVLLPNLEKNKHGIFGNPAGRAIYVSAKEWFVGGIIGGPNETDEDAIRGKKKQDYGVRVVSCLRSSDQRGDDQNVICQYFGKPDRASWLKLSEPSAISITQALISGSGRRVFEEAPATPSEYISSISIEGASIFNEVKIDFEFSPSLSTLIGGRGTGKSLILSALTRAFGLDNDWIKKSELNPSALSSWEKRHLSLFQEGGPFDNSEISIAVEYIKEPFVRYRLVLRSPHLNGESNWSLETYTQGQWELVNEYDCCPDSIDIRPLFFLQGQMSALTGEYQEDLTRLIEGPIRQIRISLRMQLEDLSTKVQEGFDKALRLSKLSRDVKSLKSQIKQKTTEQKAFQKIASAGLSEEDNALFEAANPLSAASKSTIEIEEYIVSLVDELRESEVQLRENLKDEFANIQSLRDLDVSKFTQDEGFSKDSYLSSLESLFKNIVSKISQLIKLGEDSLAELSASRSIFNSKIEGFIKKANSIAEKERHRKDAKSKADKLGEEISELRDKIKEAQQEINAIEKSGLVNRGKEALDKYKLVVQEYSNRLVSRADEISNNPLLSLIVKIRPGGRFQNILKKLQEICYGSKVPSKTWDELENFLSAQAKPALAISELIESSINALKEGDIVTIPSIWKSCGFSEKVFNNIINRTTIEDWIKLSVVLADDHVEVKYRRTGQAPIPILNASPGERAVEMLRLSLQTTSGPIIIDQPEDDLDNDFLAHNLVDLIHQAKGKNQLIFASHSANLVVHGDSDLIHVLGTIEDDSGKGKCHRLESGTIDQSAICSDIEAIMEGGRRAFETRRRKYHETIDPLNAGINSS